MKKLITIFMISIFLFFEYYNISSANQELNKKYLRYYAQYKILKIKHKWLNEENFRMIKIECKKYKISEALICALFQKESGDYCKNNWKKMIVVRGNSGEVGPGQIMPKFHLRKGETIKDLENPRINIARTCEILKNHLIKNRNNLRESLKDYNSGPASDFYNEPYIYKITKIYYETSKQLNRV